MCSGISSTAEYLAKKYHLGLYKADEQHKKHMARLSKKEEPYLYSVRHRKWSTAFVRSPRWMLRDLLNIYDEEIDMVVEDLTKLPRNKIVIVEGAVFTPQLIRNFAKPTQAIFLLATETFQFNHGQTRGEWVQKILSQYSDSKSTYKRWMKRDALFARYIKQGAKQYEYDVIDVTGQLDLRAIEKKVEQRLKIFQAQSGGF